MKLHIRQMKPSDLEQVMDIETHSFPFPWNVQDFDFYLQQKPHSVSKVIEHEGEVIAYFIWNRMDGGLEIVNLAVHWKYRKQGVGAQIMEYMYKRIKGRTKCIRYAVWEDSEGLQIFLRQMGWRCVWIDRTDEFTHHLCAYVMEYKPDAPKQKWLPVNRIKGHVNHKEFDLWHENGYHTSYPPEFLSGE